MDNQGNKLLVHALLVAWESIPKWSGGDLAGDVMEQIEAALASVGLDTQPKIVQALRARSEGASAPSCPPEKPSCTMSAESCPVHSFIHGTEAEELREGIERILRTDGGADVRSRLERVLDTVDARDSAAYLEGKNRREAALRGL